MGGDEANAAPPSDTAPGGGTFPTNASGQAYNPEWGGGSSPWLTAFGSGLEGVGSAMQGGSVPNLMTGGQFSPYIPSSESQVNPALIPTPRGGAQQDLLEALRRLLSSGGLG